MNKVTLFLIVSTMCMQVNCMNRGAAGSWDQSPASSPHCLRHIMEHSAKDILVRNPLPGDHDAQRVVVQDFVAKLPEVIFADKDNGGHIVNMRQFRSFVKATLKKLPKPESTTAVSHANLATPKRIIRQLSAPLIVAQMAQQQVQQLQEKTVTTVTLDPDGTVEVRSESPSTKRAASVKAQQEAHQSIARGPEGHVLNVQAQVAVQAGTPQGKIVVPDINDLKPEAQVNRLASMLSGRGRLVKLGVFGGGVFIAGMIVGWFYTTRAHYEASHSGAGN